MREQTPTCEETTHNCGSRIQQQGPPGDGKFYDGYRTQPNGDKTCTYCGSLSEEDFFDIIEHYVAGDPGYKFEPASNKRHKWYANRPNVTNASEGGIKFYSWHGDFTPGPELVRKNEIYDKAIQTHKRNFRAMTEDMERRLH